MSCSAGPAAVGTGADPPTDTGAGTDSGTVAMLFQHPEQEPVWGSAGSSGSLTVSDDGSGSMEVRWFDVALVTLAGDTGVSGEGWIHGQG